MANIIVKPTQILGGGQNEFKFLAEDILMNDKTTSVENKFKSYYTKSEVDSISQYLSSSISKLETDTSYNENCCRGRDCTSPLNFLQLMQRDMKNSYTINFRLKFTGLGVPNNWYIGTYYMQNYVSNIFEYGEAGMILAHTQANFNLYIGRLRGDINGGLNTTKINWIALNPATCSGDIIETQ